MRKLSAEISVFLSYILLTLGALICVTIESARLYGLKVQGANSLDLGLYSVFGEYNQELLERYDLFYVDSAYGEDYQPEKLETRLKGYMSYELNPIQGIEEKGYIDMWQMKIGECTVTNQVCATNNNGIAFRNQAMDYIKDKLNSQDKTKTYELIQQAKELSWSGVSINLEQILNMIEDGAGVNPLLPVSQLMGTSLLTLAKGSQEISLKYINLVDTISCRGGNVTGGKQRLNMIGDTGEVLWQEYLMEKFKSYTNQNKTSLKGLADSALNYELEYILYGENSDAVNLELVLNRIYQIRQEKNLEYLKNSAGKMEEVEALTLLLVGNTGNPIVAKAVKEAIIYAWAYGESLKDISSLLKGNKVAFNKTDTTWKVSINDLLVLPSVIQRDDTSDESGLNYEDYIQMFLYLNRTSTQNIRSLDLIEQNIRQTSGNGNIQLNHCIEALKVKCEFQAEPVFLKMPFVKDLFDKIYCLKKERGYSY